jgi:hypothetical protein
MGGEMKMNMAGSSIAVFTAALWEGERVVHCN